MTPEGLLIEGMLTIANKQGEDVPFILNKAQRHLDENLTGRDNIPKARQRGISSYALARGTIKCLSKRNTSAVVISHEAKATERMLAKVHYFLEHMSPAPIIGHSSKNTITFPKMNSKFYIGTAGSSDFGRGDTISFLHCSEIAFWEDAKMLMTGLMQAVPEGFGEVLLESTGNGQGNYYHKGVMDAENGKSHYTNHFFGWLDEPEYDLPITFQEAQDIMNSLDPLLKEDELVDKWNLTAGQIKFRRHKLVELEYDMNKFDQEYPKTLDECFQASGAGIFGKVIFVPDRELWTTSESDHRLMLLSPHPKIGEHYIVGGDVSAGIGKDRSCAQILHQKSMEQVGTYNSDIIPPDEFGMKLIDIGKMFNNAFITVEANNYGITTLDHMTMMDMDEKTGVETARYPLELIYFEDKTAPKGANEVQQLTSYGFKTTEKSKPFVIGKLRAQLAVAIVLHNKNTKAELSTFIESDSGKLQAEQGCFDDEVMALAMCVVGMFKSPYYTEDTVVAVVRGTDNPLAMANIIKELKKKSMGDFPIRSQVNTDLEDSGGAYACNDIKGGGVIPGLPIVFHEGSYD